MVVERRGKRWKEVEARTYVRASNRYYCCHCPPVNGLFSASIFEHVFASECGRDTIFQIGFKLNTPYGAEKSTPPFITSTRNLALRLLPWMRWEKYLHLRSNPFNWIPTCHWIDRSQSAVLHLAADSNWLSSKKKLVRERRRWNNFLSD